MLSDLQAKLEKYETKAAQYRKSAQDATGEAGRAFYEGLSRYCDELATDLRRMIAKRSTAPIAAE